MKLETWNVKLPARVLLMALPLAALAEGTRDPEWADAHLPVVDCAVHIPERFDPSDPVVLIAYTNTSDRCPVYLPIPYLADEFRSMGPVITFDRIAPESVSGNEESFGSSTRLEIPPRSVVSVPYRLADSSRIPARWERMSVLCGTGDSTNDPWFEFSRSGKLVTNGVDRVRNYDAMVARAWSVSHIREGIRADIRRYSEMKAKGESVRARIQSAGAPTEWPSLPGVEIVDGVVRYAYPRPVTFPDASTGAPSASPAPPAAVTSAPPVVPMFAALAVLSIGALTWIFLRRRKPDV